MTNAPKVTIEYLVDYELLFTNLSERNVQSNIDNLNKDTSYKGKKGFHLCGGSVDGNGEISGCLMDGTFTLYKDSSSSYKGFLGNSFSRNDYQFIDNSDYVSKTGNELDTILALSTKDEDTYSYYCSSTGTNFSSGKVYRIDWDALNNCYKSTTIEEPQCITISSKHEGSYIKSILVYFDGLCGEYATDLFFSNAIKNDDTVDGRYTSSFIIKNNKLIFMYSFGEDSVIKQITLNFKKWSKKNALLKILKIKTGYTGNYTYDKLKSLKWDENKFSDEGELTFGISSNSSSVEIFDNDDMITELYNKNLIYQNIQAVIYIDEVYQGTFFIDTKNNERGSDVWVFECIDFFERIKDDIVPMMQIDTSGTCNLKKIISWVTDRKGINIEYTEDADTICSNYFIPQAYIKSQQTLYEVLLKVCQVGLLRMYVSKGKLKITKGV